MSTFVLVPGTWSGSWSWKFVVPHLRAAGHDVHVIAPTGAGERVHLLNPDIGLETHAQDVVNLLVYEDLSDVVLVGWSYGATVVTVASHRAVERVRQVVHLDGLSPADGQSIWDVYPAVRAVNEQFAKEGGWEIPVPPESVFEPSLPDSELRAWTMARFTPATIRMQSEPARLGNPDAERLPRTLIQCTRNTAWNLPEGQAYISSIQGDPLWTIIDLDGPHIAPVSHPEETAAALIQAII